MSRLASVLMRKVERIRPRSSGGFRGQFIGRAQCSEASCVVLSRFIVNVSGFPSTWPLRKFDEGWAGASPGHQWGLNVMNLLYVSTIVSYQPVFFIGHKTTPG